MSLLGRNPSILGDDGKQLSGQLASAVVVRVGHFKPGIFLMRPGRFIALSMLVALVTVTLNVTTMANESQTHKDIEFASIDGHILKLDMYMPAAANPPLVVWIHGGGWHAGSKDKCPVAWLAEHGYAVASISYRLTDTAIFPAQIHDCKAAVRWLRANADRFGYQTERIAVAGSSAGGHLAALMGTSGDVKELEGTVGGNLEQSSRVDAVVDFYGATDFVLRSKTQPQRANAKGSVVYRLLGGGADEQVELATQASAVSHVTPDDPPFLVFHGDGDRTVLLDQSQRMVEVYTQAGLPITLHVLKGSGHGGDEFYEGRQREQMLAFLDQQLRRGATGLVAAKFARVTGRVIGAGSRVRGSRRSKRAGYAQLHARAARTRRRRRLVGSGSRRRSRTFCGRSARALRRRPSDSPSRKAS